MGVNADDFITSAFQGNFINAVVDVAKAQVERLGQALDLLGDLDELGIVVLGNAVHAHGRDGYQFTQGLRSRAAVFHPCVEAKQAIDLVLLLRGQCLVIEEGTDGRAKIVSLGDIALGQAFQELAEILYRGIAERLEDDRILLRGDVGLCSVGERGQAGDHQGSCGQVLE
ncbi:hypothetical protein D3C76_1126820 [compost metagenome]